MTAGTKRIGLVALVTLIGALFAATTGSAVGAVEQSIVTDVGTLDLVLDAGSPTWFDYDSFSGTDETQVLSVLPGTCELDLETSPLVEFTSIDKMDPPIKDNWPGLAGYSLGVGAGNEGAGTPCGTTDLKLKGNGKIANDQELTLTLGSGLSGKFIHGGEVWLKLKSFGTEATVELVGSGWSDTVDCTNAADCGPDSGDDIKGLTIPACQDAITSEYKSACADDDDAVLGTVVKISITSLEGSAGLEDVLNTKDTFFTIAETLITIDGVKWHDRDGDGERDLDNNPEETLDGWLITAYDSAGVSYSALTKNEGAYRLEVPAGQYTVCEAPPLEELGDNIFWTQSVPLVAEKTWVGASDPCQGRPLPSEYTDYVNLPDGYVDDFPDAVVNVNFGNVKKLVAQCDAGGTTTTGELLANDDQPGVFLSFTCDADVSLVNEVEFIFDAGVAPDEEAISQFVLIGGVAGGTIPQSYTVDWNPEDADYNGDVLEVAKTLVVLDPNEDPPMPEAVDFCVDVGGLDLDGKVGENSDVLHCEVELRITQVDGDQIQLSEDFIYVGDPANFR